MFWQNSVKRNGKTTMSPRSKFADGQSGILVRYLDSIPILMGSQLFFPILWENLSMNKIFCERLKELRLEKGLGQVALAKALDVGKSVISLWELGKCEPTLSKLVSMAKFFGVTIDYLAGLED